MNEERFLLHEGIEKKVAFFGPPTLKLRRAKQRNEELKMKNREMKKDETSTSLSILLTCQLVNLSTLSTPSTLSTSSFISLSYFFLVNLLTC